MAILDDINKIHREAAAASAPFGEALRNIEANMKPLNDALARIPKIPTSPLEDLLKVIPEMRIDPDVCDNIIEGYSPEIYTPPPNPAYETNSLLDESLIAHKESLIAFEKEAERTAEREAKRKYKDTMVISAAVVGALIGAAGLLIQFTSNNADNERFGLTSRTLTDQAHRIEQLEKTIADNAQTVSTLTDLPKQREEIKTIAKPIARPAM